MSDLWVFGYGSLMWRPGFSPQEAVQARLCGLHRSLCIYSWVHRGTQAVPGLVLGLDRGGSCVGTAFRIPSDNAESVVAYLRARELVTNVYLETRRRIMLEDGTGRQVEALVYKVDRQHVQYAGRLPIDVQAEIVRTGRGESGHNLDYVLSTARHLEELGIRDHPLERLAHTLLNGRTKASESG